MDMRTALGLGAVGALAGAGILLLRSFEQSHDRDYKRKMKSLERSARNIPQDPEEGERVSKLDFSGEEPIVDVSTDTDPDAEVVLSFSKLQNDEDGAAPAVLEIAESN